MAPAPAATGAYTIHTVALSPELPAVDCLEPAEAKFLYAQVHEGADYEQYDIKIQPGDVVVDVGGNIGLFALHALLATGGDVTMYVFEPVPVLAQLCERNVQRYCGGNSRVRVVDCGLTCPEKAGPTSFTFMPQYSLLSSSYTWGADARDVIAAQLQKFANAAGEPSSETDLKALRQRVDGAMQGEEVAVVLKTFADLRKELGIGERIDLLKVDVEQAELDVLLGLSKEDWAAVRQVAVEVHLEGDKLERIQKLLRDNGFSKIVVGSVGVPKFLGYKYFGLMEAPVGAEAGSQPAMEEGSAMLCNVYAVRE